MRAFILPPRYYSLMIRLVELVCKRFIIIQNEMVNVDFGMCMVGTYISFYLLRELLIVCHQAIGNNTQNYCNNNNNNGQKTY